MCLSAAPTSKWFFILGLCSSRRKLSNDVSHSTCTHRGRVDSRLLVVGCQSASVATPLWGKCEVATHTPENGTWESSRTPKNLEFNCRCQNTLPWGVFYTVKKVLKCRCPKWPCISHLNIFSTSYGRKKGREPNWQFHSRPLKVRNRPNPGACRWSAGTPLESSRGKLQVCFKPHLDRRSEQEVTSCQSLGSLNRDNFRTVSGQLSGSPGTNNHLDVAPSWSDTEYTIWGKVVASPKSGPWWVWWVKWIQSCPWLVLAPRVFHNVN
jgi:hypothetical protein